MDLITPCKTCTVQVALQVHKGADSSSYAESTKNGTLLHSHGVVHAGSPKELRLNVKGGPEATPVKSRSSSPSEPMDSHTVATLHLDSCHGCGMAPIIGC
ncbi:hypothetical protein FOZ60_015493 [Perkinsus olseni]|nr:hypothetical protein FOZ60_015493 [Perkinsus olseni]